MGDAFVLANFDRSDIPNGYRKEIQEIIVYAVAVGWTMYLTNSGDSVTLVSPVDDRKRMHLGKHRASKSVNQLRKEISKWGDSDLLHAADEAFRGSKVDLAKLKRIGDPGTVYKEQPAEVKEPVDSNCPRYERGEAHRSHWWFADSDTAMEQPLECIGIQRERNPVMTREQAKEVLEAAEADRKEATKVTAKKATPKPPRRVQTSEPTVVSVRPMQAKASEGRAYDSESTNERLWSDGRKDYTCRHPDCTSGPDGGPYATTNRLGVRAHWQRHKTAPLKPAATYAADTPDAAQYKPRQARVETLADVLKEAWKQFEKGETPDFEEIATTALTWVHEQSNQGTGLAAEREPLTPEETLVRIKTLLDDGSKGAILQETEALRHQIEDLEESLAEVTSQRDRARDTLRGLAELATEDLGKAAG